MVFYKERLWASPGLFVATALIIPATILVFAPINFAAGVILAVILYAGCIVFLVALSPRILVTDTTLFAGRARIPLEFLGDPAAFKGNDAFLERGQRLDARAWLLIRGYIASVVKIPILDVMDPVPYWLLSTRSPDRMIRALNKARLSTPEAAD